MGALVFLILCVGISIGLLVSMFVDAYFPSLSIPTSVYLEDMGKRNKKKHPRPEFPKVEHNNPNQNNHMNPASITFTFSPNAQAVLTLEDGTVKTLTEGVSPVGREIVEIDVPFTDGTSAVFKKV